VRGVTQQKAVLERYTDGFRTGDLAKILSCLTDDVVWKLH
jgi:ketosteroid isomerase-like protein